MAISSVTYTHEQDDFDPVFAEEQKHLSQTHRALCALEERAASRLEKIIASVAADKLDMSEGLSLNYESFGEALETHADIALLNSVIDQYNQQAQQLSERLQCLRILKQEPYFAKIVLDFDLTHTDPDKVKTLYLGTVGMSDDDCKRLVVDWRSPVAEVYYSGEEGPCSYRAQGRTFCVDLQLRRQFSLEQDTLHAYFDTHVAICDSLLLEALEQERTSRMKAITTTIQREQNAVIRYDDVPVLYVSGIAGSGKTSVMMQRLAYLFFRQRETLDAAQVYLITPNAVFRRYVSTVLPDLGERNPHMLTWEEFASGHLKESLGRGKPDACDFAFIKRIDLALETLEFDKGDFRAISVEGAALITLAQLRALNTKYRGAKAGSHRLTLMREALLERLENRLKSLALSEEMQDEVSDFSPEEQRRFTGDIFDVQDPDEVAEAAKRYVYARFSPAKIAIENFEWLRIERIAMRSLGVQGLTPLAWLYFKITMCGIANADARYVMVDEAQDYSPAQLAVLARYFSRAHFMLLGDEYQAISDRGSTEKDILEVFGHIKGAVDECRLLTSYRSSPQITQLFACLLPPEKRNAIQSVQRPVEAVHIAQYENAAQCHAALVELLRIYEGCAAEEPSETGAFDNFVQPGAQAHAAAAAASFASHQGAGGLCAVIVPYERDLRALAEKLGALAPCIVGLNDDLPSSGAVLITLANAKGLEFDCVIVPDASAKVFSSSALSRRRLYTTLSRAVRFLYVLSAGALSPLLRESFQEGESLRSGDV